MPTFRKPGELKQKAQPPPPDWLEDLKPFNCVQTNELDPF